MQREIKFRAWDGQEMHNDWMVFTEEAGETTCRQLAKKAVVVMQFTGLKDKNGKEIYEGDVVEYKAYNTWHRDEIKFTDGKFHGNLNGVKEELQSRYDLGLIVTLGCEIIGDIYSNPELLKNN